MASDGTQASVASTSTSASRSIEPEVREERVAGVPDDDGDLDRFADPGLALAQAPFHLEVRDLRRRRRSGVPGERDADDAHEQQSGAEEEHADAGRQQGERRDAGPVAGADRVVRDDARPEPVGVREPGFRRVLPALGGRGPLRRAEAFEDALVRGFGGRSDGYVGEVRDRVDGVADPLLVGGLVAAEQALGQRPRRGRATGEERRGGGVLRPVASLEATDGLLSRTVRPVPEDCDGRLPQAVLELFAVLDSAFTVPCELVQGTVDVRAGRRRRYRGFDVRHDGEPDPRPVAATHKPQPRDDGEKAREDDERETRREGVRERVDDEYRDDSRHDCDEPEHGQRQASHGLDVDGSFTHRFSLSPVDPESSVSSLLLSGSAISGPVASA